MAALQFSDIENRDRGKTGVVLGLGPSLRGNIPVIKSIENDKNNYKIISCNNIDRLTDINFDYWILAQPCDDQSPFNIMNAWQRYNARTGALFLYTDCLDLTPRQWVAEHLTIDYIGYDQRHWKGEHCGWGPLEDGRASCCAGIIPGRLCIQEYFQKVTGADTHYGCGDTVGVHMIALAVILGLNPIYVTGVDLNYSAGYVTNDFAGADERIQMGNSVMEDHVQRNRILDDLRIIRDCAEKIGVKIYDMDGGGRIGQVFEHKKLNI